MIRSMTGYGTAETIGEDWTLHVEVRSLNHGKLKVSPQLPENLRFKESDLIRLVKTTLSRGQVYLTVSCDIEEAAAAMLVDRDKLRGYLDAVQKVVAGENIPLQAEAGSLLNLPEVISSEGVPLQLRDQLWPDVLNATEMALDDLVEMRREEGKNLEKQIRDLLQSLDESNKRIKNNLQDCLLQYQDRLNERVKELIDGAEGNVEPDEEKLATELAGIAEHSDISEEITRMESHLKQFYTALDSEEEAVGQKLDFLVQEMQRETNTMSAKLPSSEMVELAVSMKGDVQKLREQVRNIE